jgi:hypothetical protein
MSVSHPDITDYLSFNDLVNTRTMKNENTKLKKKRHRNHELACHFLIINDLFHVFEPFLPFKLIILH